VTIAGKSMLNLSKIGPVGIDVRSPLRVACALGALLVVAACTTTPPPSGFDDPQEAKNRDMHEINKDLDSYVLRPAGTVYVSVVPKPVAQGVSNFASNMGLPGTVLNDILQFKIDAAAQNTGRFLLNSTVGILGLFDPSSAMGLYEKENSFGNTLAFYGMAEGQYIELPVLGPTTDRDLLGSAVDFFIDPTWLFVPAPLVWISYGANVASTVGDRGRYSETYDSVLYDSADSYAQARLLYLSNRRYELGQPDTSTDTFEDPYAQ
jgi:phospholipid-binding lipoprotein MlaA